MTSPAFPPGLVLILGAVLLPFLKGRQRTGVLLGFPLLTLWLVTQVPDGEILRFSFVGFDLVEQIVQQTAESMSRGGLTNAEITLLDQQGKVIVDYDSDRLAGITEEHVPKDRLDDMMHVFEKMDAYHPKEPCWYLPLIGVDPACQGRGYGSALLRHALDRCDRDGIIAYLESSNPRNISLYLRHGFVALGEIQVGNSPTLVPMLRQPK